MIFKLKNCDVGIKANGVPYDFSDVKSVKIEDPRKNRLTRGSNGTNKTGVVYTEGMAEPVKWTIEQLNMSPELLAVLIDAYENETRLDAYVIERKTGSSKMAKNAILSNRPQQLDLDETPESMNVTLELETFDPDEKHKD